MPAKQISNVDDVELILVHDPPGSYMNKTLVLRILTRDGEEFDVNNSGIPGTRNSGDRIPGTGDRIPGTQYELWYFAYLGRTAAFLGTQDAADDGLQAVEERRAAQRAAGTSVLAQIPKLLLADRAVQEASPVVDHRQHRSDLDQTVVAGG